VLPALRACNGGYIVNISSLAGIVGLPFSGLYCASKFALEGMSESLRLETRPFGIARRPTNSGASMSRTKPLRPRPSPWPARSSAF
jgi:short-subunit dehydrogenase